MAELKLKTGAVKYIIKDEFGDEIGVIKFNPCDIDIARRYKQVSESFKALEIPENPSEEDIFRITDEIKSSFDYLLHTDTSHTIFSVTNPLTPTGDGFYFVSVMGEINRIIDKELDKRAKKMDAALKDINE